MNITYDIIFIYHHYLIFGILDDTTVLYTSNIYIMINCNTRFDFHEIYCIRWIKNPEYRWYINPQYMRIHPMLYLTIEMSAM